MKKIISVACAIGIAGMMIGCGNDDNNPVETSPTDSVVLEKTTVGSDTVALAPTSSDITSDKYAYTTSDLGLISLVESSKPESLSSQDLIDDNNTTAINNLISAGGTNEPLIVSAKVAKKPIRSNDGIVTILPKFNPKLPFDTSVAVTNYKSLLAIPNNALDLLKQNLSPVATVSSDIAFYDTNGKRIWNINDKFAKNDTNVSFYLIFDPQKSGLSEGNYTLAYYKDGQFITKDINITKKSDGTLTAALDGVYPFVIAKKGGVLQKTGAITNPFEQTSFKFAVVALDENGSVVGVGKVEDNNLSLYSTAEPKKYQLVSYILKNNKVDINSTDIEITADMLNPDYPLYDNMSDDDKDTLSQIKYSISSQNMYDISLNDFLHPENTYCINATQDMITTNELCNDFNSLITSLLEGNVTDTLQETYTGVNDVNCSVVSKSIDNNNTQVKIQCANNYKTQIGEFEITTNDGKNYHINYNIISGTYSKENGSYDYIKDNHVIYVTNVVDSYSESYVYDEQNYYSKYSKKFTTKINYVGSKYLYSQSGSVSKEYSYQDYETNETKTDKLNFSYEMSKVYYVLSIADIFEDTSKFSLKAYNLYSNEENMTINGKKLIFTKDKNGAWHVNMSKKPIYMQP